MRDKDYIKHIDTEVLPEMEAKINHLETELIHKDATMVRALIDVLRMATEVEEWKERALATGQMLSREKEKHAKATTHVSRLLSTTRRLMQTIDAATHAIKKRDEVIHRNEQDYERLYQQRSRESIPVFAFRPNYEDCAK